MNGVAERVIVVEDESQIRRFVCDALRREGCSAIESATARQGLDAAAAGKTDLVILDLGLPHMSGLACIGGRRAWSHAPDLTLSARAAEEDKIAALDAGASASGLSLSRTAFPPSASNALLISGRESASGHPLMVAGEDVG